MARIGAEGFHDDPVLSWVFQDEGTRLERLEMAFSGVLEEYLGPSGRVDVVDDACMTLWRDPSFDHGAPPVEPGAEGEAPPFPEEELERLGLLTSVMAEHHPHEPHWYLFVISTLPERQGRGLGSTILAPVLEICDASGAPAYLESTNPRNMTLYRRSGFEQTDEIQLPDGPSLYPMWREPLG